MVEDQEWLIYNTNLLQPLNLDAQVEVVGKGAGNMSDQLLLATAGGTASGSQLQLRNTMRPPFAIDGTLLSSNLAAASPHMQQLMNIPNFSSLLDSSLSSSTNLIAPVIQMNDSNNNEDLLGRQQQAALLLSTPPLVMAAGEHTSHFGKPAHADRHTSTPAMLQLLTALNGARDTTTQLNYLSDHGNHFGPAATPTLNFFQGTDAAHSTLGSNHRENMVIGAASVDALDRNLVQEGHLIAGVHERLSGNSSAHDFLHLFNKDLECFDIPSTTSAASYLQLQPLDIHPPMGSLPTLFQKRAAQRRLLAPIVPPHEASSSTTATKAEPTPVGPRVTKLGSPSSFMITNQGCKYKELMPVKVSAEGPIHVAALNCSSHQLVGGEQQAGRLLQAVDDGGENFLAEDEGSDEAAGNFYGPDQMYDLGADNQEEDNCEALFHLRDPSELQIMDPVHGGSALQDMTDDDELLMGSATGDALQLAATASDQQNTSDTMNKMARGKVKGPPAKNLMAERRRRKKLNDRLYTLRSVVPKISKMDRASILGDAIEYLKELLQRINDLHNELEANSAVVAPMTTPHNMSFTNQSSSLTPTSTTANLPTPSFVKLEDCPSTSSQSLQSMALGPDPLQPPKIEVRAREGRALNIHMFCGRRPGLLLATMRALDGLGLDVQQAVISCFNGFALDVFRAEQSQEEDVEAEEIKRVLLLTATSTLSSSAACATSTY